MDAVENFTALLAQRGPGPDLDVGALAIAAGANPAVDVEQWLRELDRLAAGVDSLESLLHRLFAEERFAGNAAHYYDPRNSLLDQVLERRLGIPITLSVVCMEVGRRAGVPLEGIGMPGHFLVRPLATNRYVDAFNGGALLDVAGCAELFHAASPPGADLRFRENLLATTPRRTILARILQNLRAVYRSRAQPADLEWVMRMRLALPGTGVEEILELGEAIAGQGRFLDAAKLLEEHAADLPQHAEVLERAAHGLRAQLN